MGKIIQKEGLPFIKFMMLLSSMAPLFLLICIRGVQPTIISTKWLWILTASIIIIPFLFLICRIYTSKKGKNIISIDVKNNTSNKDYLFSYLFTVLLPLYSVNITNFSEISALIFALIVVFFVLWKMNFHFINIFFAINGYTVYTIEQNGAVLLSTRKNLNMPSNIITVHRLSNSVYIELKNYKYAN